MKYLTTGIIAAFVLALTGVNGIVQPASADDDAKINARIAAGGKSCKNEVATRVGKGVSMADIQVELGATLQESINAGEMSLKDVERGLSYNWTVTKKKSFGSCDTDGKGKVTDFQMNVE
ncbi:MAG: hypothetical protein ACK58N_11860 [Synechocystis sp.]|jgi:hypothetical protein